ncbi:hypothetical protein HPB52_017805 [Rhipicephalus sanguineus]|uniref:Uncharacterized protein n=1 Tax=Rhipicephalus sanguineus TaxID=34632 RepID=A0A9D4Q7X6_RHISA|nr:hypothetical protein HPB52_017805 [Rhipicephalus sanguineus]
MKRADNLPRKQRAFTRQKDKNEINNSARVPRLAKKLRTGPSGGGGIWKKKVALGSATAAWESQAPLLSAAGQRGCSDLPTGGSLIAAGRPWAADASASASSR